MNKKKASFSAASRKNSIIQQRKSSHPGTWSSVAPQADHPMTIFEPWEDFWSEDCDLYDDDFEQEQDYIDIYLKKIGRTR